jgi:hypothetical protein
VVNKTWFIINESFKAHPTENQGVNPQSASPTMVRRFGQISSWGSLTCLPSRTLAQQGFTIGSGSGRVVCTTDMTDEVVPYLIAEKVVARTLKTCYGGSNGIVRVSNSIKVNNFVVKHILCTLYFTGSRDKLMLDQKNITGGHLGGGSGGSGNNRSIDEAAVCLAAERAAPGHWGGGAGGGWCGGWLRRRWHVAVGWGRVLGFCHSNYCTLIIVLYLLC